MRHMDGFCEYNAGSLDIRLEECGVQTKKHEQRLPHDLKLSKIELQICWCRSPELRLLKWFQNGWVWNGHEGVCSDGRAIFFRRIVRHFWFESLTLNDTF